MLKRMKTPRNRKTGLTNLAILMTLSCFLWLWPISAWAQNQRQASSLEEFSQELNQVAEKVIPAVVSVRVELNVPADTAQGPFDFNNPFSPFNRDFFERFFGPGLPSPAPQQEQRQAGMGSGFIISSDGLILSSHHVVGEADRIVVRLRDGREFEAKVLGSDPPSDVAVIRISGGNDLPAIPLGDSDALLVGELVMAIGNPFGLAHTLTTGVVSAKGRTNLGITDYEDFIQTDASINPGNSGGPLTNMRGEVVGVNTAIFSQSGGSLGIGFAVPINMVKAVIDQLLERGEVTRGFLGIGIQNLTPDLRASFNLDNTVKGVVVTDVMENSPADRAGLQRGDIITAYNDEPVIEASQFRNAVALAQPGTRVAMTVIRNSEKIQVQAELGSQTEGEPAARTPQADTTSKYGFTVQRLTPDLAATLGYQRMSGVVVSAVTPGSPAAIAGLTPGMLISEVGRQQVASVEEFYAEIQKHQNQERVLLFVHYRGGSQYLTLPLRQQQ